VFGLVEVAGDGNDSLEQLVVLDVEILNVLRSLPLFDVSLLLLEDFESFGLEQVL
jgi:hypothetical protein